MDLLHSNTSKEQDEFDNANWRLKYNCQEIGMDEEVIKEDVYHVEIILCGLQAVNTAESLLDNKAARNLVDHVFQWLMNYTTDSQAPHGVVW